MGADSSIEHNEAMMIQKSFLLSIPLELRFRILQEVFDQATHPCCKTLHLDNRGWCPPPILQTCHQLRREGLPAWFSMEGSFDCHDLNVVGLIARDRWAFDLQEHYQIDIASRVFPNIHINKKPTNNEAVISNLKSWLHYFYWSGRFGVFLDSDVDDDFKIAAREDMHRYGVKLSFDPTDLVWLVCPHSYCDPLY